MTKDGRRLTPKEIEEGLDQWLDKKFAMVGKWTLRGVLAALFAWAAKIWLISEFLGKK